MAKAAILAGYSATPLAKKLGLKDAMPVWFDAMPDSVLAEISGVAFARQSSPAGVQAVHIFTVERAQLEQHLSALRHSIAKDGFVWVSWPKKASKRPTDITEDVIRSVALPMGWVDIKVCAVDAIWSGLKLVIRKELR